MGDKENCAKCKYDTLRFNCKAAAIDPCTTLQEVETSTPKRQRRIREAAQRSNQELLMHFLQNAKDFDTSCIPQTPEDETVKRSQMAPLAPVQNFSNKIESWMAANEQHFGNTGGLKSIG